MGDVLAFPGTYSSYHEIPLEENTALDLVGLAEDFVRLRSQQWSAEQGPTPFAELPAQCRMNRLAAEVLEIKIDRVVQRLQQQPADAQEAEQNVRSLFTLADGRPDAIDTLEEAALYTVSAYWDGGFFATHQIAPLLRKRATSAQLRHGAMDGMPATVDMVRAVVTQHVIGCHTGERLHRLHQIEQYNLLEYFDHPEDPDDFPAA